MAAGTRSSQSIAELDKKVDERYTEVNTKLEEMSLNMAEIRALLLNRNQDEQSSVHRSQRNGGGPEGGGPNHYLTRVSKVDFPKFDGRKVKDWLYRCNQFFLLDQTPAESKVRLASIHLEGLALQWHLNYIRAKFDVYPPWDQYVTDVVARFGDAYEDPLSSLIQVKHTGRVQDYIDAFELAQTQVTLLPEHALSIFLSGLEQNTQMHVRMFGPTTIAHAANLARLHESSKTHTKPSPKYPQYSGSSSVASYQKNTSNTQKNLNTNPTSNTNQTVKPVFSKNTKLYSAEEMEERRSKGLCMFCDEPFTPGHQFKHKRAQFMVMEMDDDVIEPSESVEEATQASQTDAVSETPLLSMNALTGTSNFQTMRVTGLHNKKTIHVLIDSGSTHNFLDLAAAKRLGCKLESVPPMSVTAGGGNKIQAPYLCRGFTWQLQNSSFNEDVIVMPLVCCDLVLGVQWLKSLGQIVWDFNKLQMEFTIDGRKCMLRSAKPPSTKLINNKKLTRSVHEGAEICFLYLNSVSHSLTVPSCQLLAMTAEESTVPQQISGLLETYADVFDEPHDLPPIRPGFDHRIPLKDGIIPFNLKPYRYSIVQKDVVDKLVNEMLSQGVIRHSNSPFASPAVLVRKKDGSWRLCVDYRRLNQHTIKDRFPIPLVEDLMDELGSAVLFSKLDLRSGFNQLRIELGDEFKTAFKTHSGHFEYLVMPFGLTNAPASFQSLMNHIFKPYLRKFVIVFFDDILVYSATLEAHVEHLSQVFSTARANQLYFKKSKCQFATSRIEYLGHFISQGVVSTDPSKVKAVQDWPQPTDVKQLRGFLGLAGYYRRFVKNFGKIAKPLTELLKKDSFMWTEAATEAFEALKFALTSSPVLALPDFSKTFVVETDASGKGIGAVLMQDKHPLAFISKALGPRQLGMSIYERELLAVVYAIQKWGTYLAHKPFVIRTDQKSIKYLLEQKLNTPFQQVWMSKLMGFDFEIHYKEGVANTAADALSRKPGAELLPLLLDNAQTGLLELIKATWQTDPTLQTLVSELQANPNSHPKFTWFNGELRRKGKLVVGSNSEVKLLILQWLHDSFVGGHSGRDVTATRVKSLFFWKGMAKEIQHYVRNCVTCQKSKPDLAASPGLLQPLPIPNRIWDEISMDFIEGLPSSHGKQVIFVVVDRLSKYAHFIALSHPYTALDVAQAFLDNIFKLHGMPSTIVSDRDPVFLSSVWTDLFTLQGVSLNKSTAYHPQTDGQTEIVNKCLETYLRCMCTEKPSSWFKWLSLAEWWYNTHFHSSIQTSPYEVVYGQAPPIHLPYLPSESPIAVVDRTLSAREAVIKMLKFHLLRAQNRMAQQANKRRSDRVFCIGDYVFLKLQPYRQTTMRQSNFHKLSPKYFGPFKVLDRIGATAYKLELPSTAGIHDVIHVSQLKLCSNPAATQVIHLPHASATAVREPAAILDRKMVKRGRVAATKVLVQWKDSPLEAATWEFYYDFLKKFPNFNP